MLLHFGVDGSVGLEDSAVAAAREAAGFNELPEAKPVPGWRKFLRQFADLVIWILIVSAVISGAMGEWVDSLAILAIVLLNAVIGFLQEERAERSLAALRQLSAPLAKVIRSGIPAALPARALVPGDVIEIEAGDHVPADARLVSGVALRTQEAALTGESATVGKDAAAVVASDAGIGDRRNMVHMGTVVAGGRGTAVVVATGLRTELGRIAGLLQGHEPEPTPLQRRLAELGRVLIGISLAVVAVVFVLQMLRGGRFVETFLLAVTIAVAAVPEGLPAVVTIALALGLQRMVKRNALIRRLPSVETLGSVNVICSDKTGTLTRNEMTVREFATATGRYAVTGSGYLPKGQFLSVAAGQAPVDVRDVPDLRRALEIGAFCNNAKAIPRPEGAAWQIVGDPTEGALLIAAMKAGAGAVGERHPVLVEIPFDSQRKSMSVVTGEPGSPATMYTKGAPEVILNLCNRAQRDGRLEPLTDDARSIQLQTAADMASRALRVLGLAYKPIPTTDPAEYGESDLVFVGLVEMMDPPREEAKHAVRRCQEAGIRPVMITGDHPATALAVARELGMTAATDAVVSGMELEAMSDEQLAARADDITVYSRVSAEHKLRVVRALKSRGHVVAMTGDGVNDAPAIKTADIGIAMGITGTDVTKEASAMVLMDDNFASIVNAVEEGRGIFDNIQKVVLYLLSCNFGEILLMLVASLTGWPAPLVPVQLLWINLVTDGFPALALALERPEPGVMSRPPRPARASILSRGVLTSVLLQGLVIGCVAMAAFAIGRKYHPDDVDAARGMTFCVVVYAELLRSIAARSQSLTVGQLGLFTNPALLMAVIISGLLQVSIVVMPFTRKVFELTPHSAAQWAAILVLSFTPVTVIELSKLAASRLRVRRQVVPQGATS